MPLIARDQKLHDMRRSFSLSRHHRKHRFRASIKRASSSAMMEKSTSKYTARVRSLDIAGLFLQSFYNQLFIEHELQMLQLSASWLTCMPVLR